MNTHNGNYKWVKNTYSKQNRNRAVSFKFVLATLFLVLTLAVSGCAPEAIVTPTVTRKPATATLPPTVTSTLTPTPTETPSLEVSSLDGVRQATIQILTQGTFRDPENSVQQLFAGKGSGFIISESGIAVTNNHVVTGAAIVEVKLPDEEDARSARVLGVSECSDLAVIDIDGEGFNYIAWYQEPITVGMVVYAAGFPLGDPEYTLTQGIVSKQHADGEVSWASVDYVLEHDANLNPGNSGGPLVTQNGQVVGVNYASYKEADQSFAITRDEALNILETLTAGKDVDSIGVNGLAISDSEDHSGIWISSVRSGSQADESGILPGDLITKMEGMEMARDGTMSAYCDILRSRKTEDTLNIEVKRLDTNEILEGQINGDRLEVVSKVAYSEFVAVTDDLEIIEAEIPAEWSDIDGSPWVIEDEVLGASIIAAADLNDYYNTWDTPGVWIAASESLVTSAGHIQVLDWAGQYYRENCDMEGRHSYEDANYRGKYDVFLNCGGEEMMIIVLSAVPVDRSSDYLILVSVAFTPDQAKEVLQYIVGNLNVVGDLSKVASAGGG